MSIQLILLSVVFITFALVAGFFILVVIGNLTAMKFLAKNGLAVFSHNIVKDTKLLNYVNKEGACWLSIPEVCYSPVMYDCNGKYKNHNFLQKENSYGELFVLQGKRSEVLSQFAKDTPDLIKDLTIISGSPKGNGTDLRHANFSLLRKVGDSISENSRAKIQICENGRVRNFKPVALIEQGLSNHTKFEYSNRKEFIEYLLNIAKVKSIFKEPSSPVFLLECNTGIDTVIVLIMEVENKI